MAVSKVIEMSSGRSASLDLNNYHRTYTRKFRVIAANNDTFTTILGGAGLPVVNVSTHPDDSGALCVKYSIVQKEFKESQAYDLSFDYDSSPPIAQNRIQDPLSRPPIITIEWQKQQQPFVRTGWEMQ